MSVDPALRSGLQGGEVASSRFFRQRDDQRLLDQGRASFGVAIFEFALPPSGEQRGSGYGFTFVE